MMRPGISPLRMLAGLTGALAAFLLMPVPETRGEDPQPPLARAREADQQLLRQVMLEAGVTTDRPRPGLTLWSRDAGSVFSRWLVDWMERVVPRVARRVAPFFESAVMIVLALLSFVLLVFLARFAFDRWRARPPSRTPAPHLGAATAPRALGERDREAELRRCLESGDVVAAIEALWWWLASRLMAESAEPSWTSRELVTKAGRRDLLADVRRLDRMMYGAARPSSDEVGRLWSDLRGLVA